MTLRHLTFLFLAPFLAVSVMPTTTLAAGGMMRVPQSLMNESEHSAPLIPEFGYKKKLKKQKAAKKVDPMKAIRTRMIAGKKVTDKPTFIMVRTVIAWPSPTKQGTGKSHGSALGDDEVAATKTILGFDPKKTFEVDRAVITHTREVKKRGKFKPGPTFDARKEFLGECSGSDPAYSDKIMDKFGKVRG